MVTLSGRSLPWVSCGHRISVVGILVAILAIETPGCERCRMLDMIDPGDPIMPVGRNPQPTVVSQLTLTGQSVNRPEETKGRTS